MNNLKQHIGFKLTCLLLIAVLLIPAAVKFNHIFSHHKHKVCLGDNSTHIHKVDLDCEFHKFQLNNIYISLHYHDNVNYLPQYSKITFLTYKYFHNHRQLSFSLRGPPVLV